MKKNYREASFWDEKYKINMYQHQQWLQTAADSAKLIAQHLGTSKDIKILELGCGTSNLSDRLYKLGYENIKCVDFCKELIKNRKKKQNNTIQFAVQDITKMQNIQGQTYDIIIDKCTIDCLFCATDQLRSVLRCMKQCYRILNEAGKMLIISHGRPKVRKFFLRNKIAPFQRIIHQAIKIKKQAVGNLQTVAQTCNYLYILKKTQKQGEQDKQEHAHEQQGQSQQEKDKEEEEGQQQAQLNQDEGKQDEQNNENNEDNLQLQQEKNDQPQFILDGKKTIKNSKNKIDPGFILDKTKTNNNQKQQVSIGGQQNMQQNENNELQGSKKQQNENQQGEYQAQFQQNEQQNNQQQQQTEQTDFILM